MKPDKIEDEIVQIAASNKNASWDVHYQALLEFYQQNKHANVPRKDSTVSLAKWLSKQRTRKSKLSPEQVQKLNAVQFEWNSKSVLDDIAWKERYTRLQAYTQEHGNANVPQKHPADQELGTWVANQRRRYNQGKLRADRQTLLESLDFNFLIKGGTKPATPSKSTAYDIQWEKMFLKLVEFKEQHGHTNVVQNDGELGMWVSTQRRCFHKKTWNPNNKIKQDRKDKLDSIGFEWTRVSKKKKDTAVEGRLHKRLKTAGESVGGEVKEQDEDAQMASDVVEEAGKVVDKVVTIQDAAAVQEAGGSSGGHYSRCQGKCGNITSMAWLGVMWLRSSIN